METGDSASANQMDGEKWESIKEERRSSRSPASKNNKDSRSRDSSDRRQRSNRSRSPRRTRAPTNRRIYVANIPYDCKWTIVKDLFREKVGEVSYVELFEDESGKFRGCGIVEFKDSSSVQKAVDTMHRFAYKGRQLVVKEDFDVDRDKTGKPLGRGGRRSSDNMDRDRDHRRDMMDRERDYRRSMDNMESNNGVQFNTYGLSPQFLHSLGINGPLTSHIFVANLDYKITTQKLEEVFKLAGRVVKIDLKRDESGKSKGHGTIEMGHPVEAVQAISMFNGQRLNNRTMSVRMDKKNQDDPEEKRLPDGLSGVGKGLGANGLPLHLSNAAGVGNLAPTGIPPVGSLGGLGPNSLSSLMASQLSPAMVGGNAGGVSGLSGIGMSIQERNYNSLGSSLGTSLGLGGNSTTGLGSSLLSSSLGGLSSSATGLGTGGLGVGGGFGSSLTSSLGLSLGASSVGTTGTLGYGDYDRSYDRGDSLRLNRSSDSLMVRNLPLTYTWEDVREKLRDIGNVQTIDMKGRGTAIIRFLSNQDAVNAAERLQGTRIFGRLIDVSLY